MLVKRFIKARDLQAKQSMFEDFEFNLGGKWREVLQADVYRMPNSPLILMTAGMKSFNIPMDDKIEFRKKGTE